MDTENSVLWLLWVDRIVVEGVESKVVGEGKDNSRLVDKSPALPLGSHIHFSRAPGLTGCSQYAYSAGSSRQVPNCLWGRWEEVSFCPKEHQP